jgi:asparagine synthase (glutamine-hydrolysing)
MCGICGILDYNKNRISDKKNIQNMCDKLQHRGPDDEGIYINNKFPLAAFGHRRLSIIDLNTGHQPMSNEDNSLWLVINGEIYNFLSLRKELKDRGHRFKTNTDSEVVLHLYEDFGEDCVLYLRGMFAFAIWDENKNKLFIARDRIGKKPLLYFFEKNCFCFASEFEALLASGLIGREINHQSLDQYLTFGYVPAPNTIYKNIFKILPAHHLTLINGKLEFKKYWELDYRDKFCISEEEATKELIRALKEAVSLRLISDVPLGVFLSGGIDSSTVVALTSELAGKVKTFSIGFEDENFDELKYARNIARRFSTEHREFIVKPKALEILPLLVRRYGEPYADSSAIPSYYVARETKRFVTVALNGDGGDESFAGYERYQAMMLAQSYNHIPGFLRNMLNSAVMHLVPDSPDFKNKRRRIRRFFENASMPFYLRYCRWVSMINDKEKSDIYSPEFKGRIDISSSSNWLKDCAPRQEKMQLTDRLMALDIKTNLPNDLLVKMDIACMSNSLEARSPFLDQEVMQFAARLSANFKLKGMIKKYILKKSIRNLLPAENIHRPKMGFGVPVGRWMRQELRDYIQDTLLSENAFKRGYFTPAQLRLYVNEHLNGKMDHTFGLWTLLCLELWHKEFID